MKTVHCPYIFATILVVFAPGCKDDEVSAGGRPAGLYAQVVGSNGSALPNVNVHYIFYTTTNPVVQNVWIQYGLSTPQTVTLKVFGPFGQEVKTLINALQQPAGQHSILFDSSVTNGVYTYRLQLGDSVTGGLFYIRNDDVAQLVLRPPLASIRCERKVLLVTCNAWNRQKVWSPGDDIGFHLDCSDAPGLSNIRSDFPDGHNPGSRQDIYNGCPLKSK